MLLCFAFSSADYEAAVRLAKFFKFVPNQQAHDLLLATTPDLVPVRNEIEGAVGPLFARTHTLTIPNLRTGWPAGCNSYFHAVARHIAMNIPCEGWYFFEAGDSVPTRPGWLDELEKDYRRGMRPVMGVIHPSYKYDGKGLVIPDGQHVVGTAVYPRNLPQSIRVFDSLTVATTAFDVLLQWYLVPYAHHTELIQHLWRTEQFSKQKDGSVLGQPCKDRPDFLKIKPVDWDAAVIHGCKDDSLLNIIRGKLAAKGVKPVKIEKKKFAEAPSPSPAAPTVDPLTPALPGGGWK